MDHSYGNAGCLPVLQFESLTLTGGDTLPVCGRTQRQRDLVFCVSHFWSSFPGCSKLQVLSV